MRVLWKSFDDVFSTGIVGGGQGLQSVVVGEMAVVGVVVVERWTVVVLDTYHLLYSYSDLYIRSKEGHSGTTVPS